MSTWAVACVITRSTRKGDLQIALRHGLWTGSTKDAAVGSASAEALASNPGWSLFLVNAVEALPLGGEQEGQE